MTIADGLNSSVFIKSFFQLKLLISCHTPPTNNKQQLVAYSTWNAVVDHILNNNHPLDLLVKNAVETVGSHHPLHIHNLCKYNVYWFLGRYLNIS